MDEKRSNPFSYFSFMQPHSWWRSSASNDIQQPCTMDIDGSAGPAKRTVALMPPDDEKEELFKAVVPKKLAGDVDINVGPKGLTVGLSSEGQTQKLYTMPEITDKKYQFIKSESNPKITYDIDCSDPVVNFSLMKK